MCTFPTTLRIGSRRARDPPMDVSKDDDLTQAAEFVRNGDLPGLERALAANPRLLSIQNTDGDTLLSLACCAATGDIAIPPDPGTPQQHAAVDRLLAAGADPSAANSDGWTPLHTAAMAGHLDLVDRLLAAGASREGNLFGCEGGSPLSLALFYAKTEVADRLASPAIPDNLRSAAGLGRPMARFVAADLLTADAFGGLDFYRPGMGFPEWKREKSRQEILDESLCWASRNDQCTSMAALVDLGANVNANPYRGTPLLWAIYADQIAAATWLLDNGADPDLRHDFGGAGHGVQAVAMHLAAQYESLKCLQLLLERGADPTITDEAYSSTPLGWAEHVGAESAIKILSAL